MGKPKKGKKDVVEEDIDDVADGIGQVQLSDGDGGATKPSKKQKAKKKKKQRASDSEPEGEPAEVKVTAQPKAKVTGGGGFNMLSMLGDEGDMMDDDDDDDDEDNQKVEKPKQKDVVLSPVDNDIENISAPSKKKKKDKKKKNRGGEDDEDELDAILADIEAPAEKKGKKSKKSKQFEEAAESIGDDNLAENLDNLTIDENGVDNKNDKGEGDVAEGKKGKKKKKHEEDMTADDLAAMIESKGVEKVMTIDDLENEYEDKKKKKKGKKTKEVKEEVKEEGEEEGKEGKEGEEEGLTMKTAAQKKKDKKEREKKEREKKKKDKTKSNDAETTAKEEVDGESEVIQSEVTEVKAAGEVAEAAADDEAPSKKKKKGKKDKEEKGKDKEKKPKNKQIAAIREHLRMLQEEEQRAIREAEDKERREEEARLAKEEEKRLAEEKKQLKKQREKEKIERQKKEGTYLTAKQKQEKRRAEQMLEIMRAQGMAIPDRDAAPRKKPVYTKRRGNKPQTPTEEVKKIEDLLPSPTEVVSEPVKEEAKEEEHDDIKDAWDDSEEEEEEEVEAEEVKDEESTPVTEDKPTTKTPSVERQKSEEKRKSEDKQKSEESEESDSEEESESESSSEESDSEEDSSSESEDDSAPLQRARDKIMKRHEEAEKNRSVEVLRAPVVCVLGHVDTGKTKILDKLRRTNVQDGEAGGITQQIGATNVPREAILEKTQMCKEFQSQPFKLPGMLIIDTPGHESFSNLRTRGSSLCDIAVLVVDIMHGLEPQTIESINLLRKGNTPFVVALNKIDRLYQWKPNPNADVISTLSKQQGNSKLEFDTRVKETIVQFAEQSLNVTLFHENKNPREYISMVPTSAHSGDGMGDLLALMCQLSQTMLTKRISYSEEIQATVMEVKLLPGLGTTIDVIVVNGVLKEGSTVVIAGTDGPIVSQIRGLLLPQPMKELRVKAQYDHCKTVQAAQGVKIIGKDFEKAMAGLPFYVAYDEDEVLFYKEELKRALEDVLGAIKLSDRGVFVQASTIGSLEALLEFLKTSKIPYAGINIGPVHKKDIMKASVMLEHDSQYAVILAFDVKIEREATEMADTLGVRIFAADIIYHLFDKFMAYRDELKKAKQEEFRHVAVYPCKVRILPQFIFNSRDPIVAGVQIEAGVLKVGTPICVPSKEFLDLGRVSSIENNHKMVESARKGQEVCIKIESSSNDAPKMFGRHFDHTDILVSKISRQSIDVMKEWFREELQKSDWQLIVELKKTFEII